MRRKLWKKSHLIFLVVGWSYYAFVIELNINIVQTLTEKVLFIIFYHFILILFLWSYAATVFAPPCVTPPTWTLSSQVRGPFLYDVYYLYVFQFIIFECFDCTLKYPWIQVCLKLTEIGSLSHSKIRRRLETKPGSFCVWDEFTCDAKV